MSETDWKGAIVVAAILSAGLVAYSGNDGWGWLVALAIIGML